MAKRWMEEEEEVVATVAEITKYELAANEAGAKLPHVQAIS